MSIDLENSKRKAAKASKFPEDVVLGMPNVEILGLKCELKIIGD